MATLKITMTTQVDDDPPETWAKEYPIPTDDEMRESLRSMKVDDPCTFGMLLSLDGELGRLARDVADAR